MHRQSNHGYWVPGMAVNRSLILATLIFIFSGCSEKTQTATEIAKNSAANNSAATETADSKALQHRSADASDEKSNSNSNSNSGQNSVRPDPLRPDPLRPDQVKNEAMTQDTPTLQDMPATQISDDEANGARSSDSAAAPASASETSEEIPDQDQSQAEELSDSDDQVEVAGPQFEVADEQTIEIPDTWKRLGENEIWIDVKNKQVIMAGYICINVGALEMFACPAGTKEHESVVAVNALASEMHAALLAVGAQPGAPCSWDDVSFTTASGSKISIDVRWRDEKTNEIVTRAAKEMIKIEGQEQLDLEWVFGGSRFREDLESKTRYYSANSGEMICVSNFSTAAIDVNIDSTDANGSWLFWANTENVPPRGARVYMILTPGEFLKATRQIFEESEPAPLAGEEATREPDPATGKSDVKESNPESLQQMKIQTETPKAEENSNQAGSSDLKKK